MTSEQDVRDLWPETMHDEWMDPAFEEGLVSVIVPTYNRAGLLPETLESVRQQTYRPIELIVVDDGSTDETRAVLHQWKEAHEGNGLSVRLLEQENSGAPAARNRGLIESAGEFIQYLDSDDLLHPHKLEAQVAAIRATSARYTFSGVKSFSNTAELSTFSSSPPKHLGGLVQCSGQTGVLNIPHLASRGLYDRSLAFRVGPWNENLERWQDFEYNVRVALQQIPYVETEGSFHFWRNHSSGRIEDLSGTDEGVDKGLKTMNVVDDILGEISTKAKLGPIKRPYLRLLKEAMDEGSHEQVREVVSRIQRQELSVFQKSSLKVVYIIYRIAGSGFAIRAMNEYPRIRLLPRSLSSSWCRNLCPSRSSE